jgi:hypothetical protein
MKKQVLAMSVLALGLAVAPVRADFNLLLRDVTGGGTDTQVNDCNEAETIIALGAPDATYNFTDTRVTRTVINLPGGGNFGTDDPLPDGTTGQGKEDYILNAKAYVRIPAGDWSIGFGSDDGGRLQVGGITFLSENGTIGDPANGDNEVFFNNPRGHGWTWGTFTLASQLDTTLDALQFERSGGDSFEIAIYAGHAGSAPASWVLLQDGAEGWTVSADPLIDTNPPSITVLSPADDASGVNPAADLAATFDENIVLTGSGTVSIVNIDASTQVDITLPDPQVTVSGTDLTIAPTNDLGFGTNYAVRISGDAVADLWAPPNAFAGITNNSTWNFTVAAQDLTAPVITNTVPADDASGVTPNANLVAIFDDGIVAGAGSIVIYNVTDATNLTTIAVSNASQVSISGNVLTIDPDVDLAGGKEFALQIEAGAVENYSGVAFAGISDTATWSFSVADTTTFTGPNKTNGDNWNVPGNWDLGIPAGVLSAVIPTGKQVTSDGGSAQVYSGNLTVGTNAYLQVGWVNPRHEDDFNALGTPGTTTISMQDGSHLHFRAGSWGTVDIPAIELQGNASLTMNTSTEPASNYRFPYGINGPHTFTLKGKGNQDALLTTSNTFNELIIISTEGSYDVFAGAELSLNGDVTVEAYSGLPAADLSIDATNAMADTATLAINGSTASALLTMNAADTVSNLWVNGYQCPAGAYDGSRTWVSGSGTLTVLAPADTNVPAFGSFVDDVSGGPIPEATVSLGYTVTFNDFRMDDTTVDASDFSNAGTASVTISDVAQASSNSFTLRVYPHSAGSLQLQIDAGADIKDMAGLALDTASAIQDDTTITIEPYSPPPPPPRIPVTFDGFVSWDLNAGNGTYDASGSDKLVVVVSGEHNFNQTAAGQVHGVTYDGQPLIKAVDVDPVKYSEGGHGDTATDIWYLDKPGDFHTAGTIAVSVNGNNYVYTAMGLSDTAEGVGVTAAGPGASFTKVAVSNDNSMVVFNVGMGGSGNTASPLPGVTANAPTGAVTIAALEIGNNWAGHSVGRVDITAAGVYTFSFDTAKDDIATIAAEFPGALISPPDGTAVIVR